MRHVLWMLIAFAFTAAGQEIAHNKFIAHDYFRIKVRIPPLAGDTTLYIPTEVSRSGKVSDAAADFYIRSRWVSSSGFEYIFPSSVRIHTGGGTLQGALFYTIRGEQTPAEIDLLFRIPAVSHEKKIYIMGKWINLPIDAGKSSEEGSVDRLFELAEKEAAEGMYESALKKYIQIILADKNRYDRAVEGAARVQTELAAEYLSRGNTDDAYILLSSARSVKSRQQSPLMSRTDSLYARCLSEMGEKRYEANKPGEALYFLGQSLELLQNPPVQHRYEYILAEKRSPWTLGLLGLFPGGGQFYKGEYAKGAIMAGLFVAGLSIMSINFDEADKSDQWADYYHSQIAGSFGNDRFAFTRLEYSSREEAKRKNQIGYTALTVSCVTLLWSIYDGIYSEDELYRIKKPDSGFDLSAGVRGGIPGINLSLKF